MRLDRSLLALALVFSPVLTGCSATKGAVSTTQAEDDGAWLQPSPGLARQIQLRSIEVESAATQDEYVRLSDWFQSVGEPAYPALLDLAGGNSARGRSFALSVIAAMGERRLLEPLREVLPFESLDRAGHRYEYARALVKLGDFSKIPVLIGGLEDENLYTRAVANEALKSATNNAIPFRADGPPEERAQAVAAWREWWSTRSADGLLER